MLERHLRETIGRLERSLRCIYETLYKKTMNKGFRKLCDVNQILKVLLSPSCSLFSKKHSLAQLLKTKSLSQLFEKTLLHTTLKQKTMTLLYKSQPLWCNSHANHSPANHSHFLGNHFYSLANHSESSHAQLLSNSSLYKWIMIS